MKSIRPRIVSLVPSATEIIYLLGLGDNLVARSHNCDFPLEVKKKKVISSTKIRENLSSFEIDKAVKNLIHQGTSVFHVDQTMLKRLKPDLILTQELCKVCAPTFSDVTDGARLLDGKSLLLSLEPKTIQDVFNNIFLVAEHTGVKEKARAIVERLKYRLDNVYPMHKNLRKPTAVIVEWLNPVMISGHWVPQMVKLAGGELLLSKPKDKSRYVDWIEIVEANPDVLIFAPCGFDIEQTKKEIYLFKYRTGWDKLKAVKNDQVYYLNGDAHITRSGPRLVDGIEILAKIFHPHIFGYPKSHEAVQMV